MLNVLVSACLLGEATRYDGASKPCKKLIELQNQYHFIPVCPEVMGGLPVPRTPCERIGTSIMSVDGLDRTQEYTLGKDIAIKLAKEHQVAFAILKARSPSCGKGQIYDGTFQGVLKPGNGVLVDALNALSIPVYTEEELDQL